MLSPAAARRVSLGAFLGGLLCGALPLWAAAEVGARPMQGPLQEQTQDPEPELRNPQAPPDAMPLAPVPEGLRSAVERRDLADTFLPTTPLEGVWRLTRMAQGSGDLGRVEGYLIAGRRHLLIHLLHGEPGGGKLFVQSGARQYQLQDGYLVTSALAGHDNLSDGQRLRFDTPGRVERRRIELAGSRLTIHQTERSFMEFVRVE